MTVKFIPSKFNTQILYILLSFLLAFIVLKWVTTNPNCNPCFSYFKYVDHTDRQLNVLNGNKKIDLVKTSVCTVYIPNAEL